MKSTWLKLILLILFANSANILSGQEAKAVELPIQEEDLKFILRIAAKRSWTPNPLPHTRAIPSSTLNFGKCPQHHGYLWYNFEINWYNSAVNLGYPAHSEF